MKYNTLASKEDIDVTVESLRNKGIDVEVLIDEQTTLSRIQELISNGTSVMNGSSRTLEQIGFVELLKSGVHRWNNLHAAIVAEKDPEKQSKLRKQAVLSDYYVGSVHALTKDGQMVIASNTGSQLPHVVYTSKNLIFVVGAQKIVNNLGDALKRLEDYVIPLEDENMKQKYGVGTSLNKIVIFRGENKMMGRSVRVLIVNKELGF